MKLWRVDDVMTKDVVSVREDTPYRAVVDLLKVHQRTDAEIRRDVVDEALHDVLAIKGALVQVESADGVVTLSGRVHFRSAAERIARTTRRVPGVVDVADRLTFEVDDSLINGSDIGTPFGVA
jgi:osmotically-inducible protein OsmY